MKYFISYGNNNFSNAKERIKHQAEKSGFFDKVDVFSPEDLSKEFIEKTTPYINDHRGGGYWIWKIFFIKKYFDEMKENDILVYADAGCTINKKGEKRMNEYIEMLNKSQYGILSFDTTITEKKYTNEKVMEFFKVSEEIKNSGQLMSTILYLRKCNHSIQIIDKYYDIAITNPILFSDAYNNYKRTSHFIDHRHDQSIFSILRKINGSIVIPDETWSQDFSTLLHIPILATRLR